MIILVFFFSNPVLNCQITYIFKDDTLLKTSLMSEFKDTLIHSYRCISFLDLKERLPDGEYLVLGINRRDSSRNEFQKQIIIRGFYKDSKRDGRFDYYQRIKRKWKYVSILTHSYTYKDGILDGYFFCSNTRHKIIEGYFKDGKEHGFFIYFDFDGGWINEIEFYQEGVVLYKVRYRNGEMLPVEKHPLIIDSNFQDNQVMPKRIEYPSE